jgi:hypothetical protein
MLEAVCLLIIQKIAGEIIVRLIAKGYISLYDWMMEPEESAGWEDGR